MSTRETMIRRSPSRRPLFAGMRLADRKPASLSVRVIDESGWAIPFESVNISESGLFVRSRLLFEVGEVHELQIGGEGGVRVRARIARVEAGREASGMAYEFVGDEVGGSIEALVGAL